MTRATVHGTCDRCDEPIRTGQPIALRHGSWVHRGCMPGADDE